MTDFYELATGRAKRNAIAAHKSLAAGTVIDYLALFEERKRSFNMDATDGEVRRKTISIVGHFL